MSFTTDDQQEFEYFKKRSIDKIYVTKSFPFKSFSGDIKTVQRYVRKVFDKTEDNEFVKIKGEIILRSSPSGRDQISALIIGDEEKFMTLTLQKFRNNPKTGLVPIENTSFTFYKGEFLTLLKFLSDLKFIDFKDPNRFVVDESENFEQKISNLYGLPKDENSLLNHSNAQFIELISDIKGSDRVRVLKALRDDALTEDDLNILTGRKEGLEIFSKQLLQAEQVWIEKDWQSFFMINSWIFGYGLDYRFLNIIQKEASVSDIGIDGSQTVISDFLMGDSRFTVLVELKKPNTPIFENSPNRSMSWRLSKELTNAVSQILTQKAEWELKSQERQFKNDGKPLIETTVDPKTILIIGNTNQFKGDDRDSLIKSKTFELFRRNSRNIEIITYDELFERASFIVSNKRDHVKTLEITEDDLF